jgi:hypothetical protein
LGKRPKSPESERVPVGRHNGGNMAAKKKAAKKKTAKKKTTKKKAKK